MRFVYRHPIRLVLCVVATLVASSLLLASCGCTKEVSVQTGMKTVCVYGETLDDTVRTIKVPESQAKKYRVITKRVLCDKHRLAQKYFEQGQALARQGKYPEALKAFQKAAEYDPDFKDVSTWIASGGKSGGSSTPSNGSSSSNGGGSSGSSSSASTAAWLSWFPATDADYVAGSVAKDKLRDAQTAQRNYTPKPARSRTVATLVITLYKYKTAQKASAFIVGTSKTAFPSNRKTISSFHNAYFGTRGPDATLAWVIKDVVVEMVMQSAENKPATLSSHMLQVAKRVK